MFVFILVFEIAPFSPGTGLVAPALSACAVTRAEECATGGYRPPRRPRATRSPHLGEGYLKFIKKTILVNIKE